MRMLQVMDSRGRQLALVLVAAIVLGVATCADVRAQDAREYPPLDPRFEREPSLERKLKDGPVDLAYRWPRDGTRPQRCSIRRTVETDFLPENKHRRVSVPDAKISESVAPLREYEFGFERVGDPATSNRIEAFMRFRFARLSDGKPLSVDRPVMDYEGDWGSTMHWLTAPLDAEGFSGARIDIEATKQDEIFILAQKLVRGFRIAMTLPELGEDRVYRFGRWPREHDEAAFAACLCAFEDKRLDDELLDHCGR